MPGYDPRPLLLAELRGLAAKALSYPDPRAQWANYIYALTHPPRGDTGFGAHVIAAGESFIASTVLTPLGASALNLAVYGRSTVPIGALMSYNWEYGEPDMGDVAGADDVIGSSDVGGPDTILDTSMGWGGPLPGIPINLGGGAGSVWNAAPTQQSVQGGMVRTAGVLPAMGRAIAAMSPVVVGAIIKLSRTLGGAGGSVVGYGTRVWTQLSSWAAKNPGVSLVSMLVSLGLTVEEAAHFIAWGTTRKKRRRARGVSGRDLKTTRRTMRKLNSYVHQLRALCGPVQHHRAVYHRRRR